MEEEGYYFSNEIDDSAYDSTSVVTERVINFKRRKIDELEQELQQENLEGEIIILDTDIALKPETLQVQLKEDDEYSDEGEQVFEDGRFVDADGNTYELLDTEDDETTTTTTTTTTTSKYYELDTILEEGEVRGATDLLKREQYIESFIDEKYQCPLCQRSFTQKGNLYRHYQTHTGDKPFTCTLCGHKFTQKSNLQKHLATHNGEKRFECGMCNKGFVQKANLVRHLRIHTGEKPFQCDLCGHKFTQKGNLNKHMQLHTSETECVCDFCDCKFPSYTSKLKHETSIHKNKLHESEEEEESYFNNCDECPAHFRTKRALIKHKKFHN